MLLAQPFWGAITWALSLAILFAPFHAWVETKLKHPNLAAMVSVLTIVRGAASVRTRVADGDLQRLLDAHPGIAPLGKWINQQIDLPSTLASLAEQRRCNVRQGLGLADR